MARRQEGLALPVDVVTAGGTLRVYAPDDEGRPYLEGPVQLVFEGRLLDGAAPERPVR